MTNSPADPLNLRLPISILLNFWQNCPIQFLSVCLIIQYEHVQCTCAVSHSIDLLTCFFHCICCSMLTPLPPLPPPPSSLSTCLCIFCCVVHTNLPVMVCLDSWFLPLPAPCSPSLPPPPSFLSPGSKCPSGEFLYILSTEDNDRVRRIFNDLSHHKPIFTDDRMGRRMTQEHIFLQQIRSGDNASTGMHTRLGSRHSLQPLEPHNYENTGVTRSGRHRISVQEELHRPRSQAVTKDGGLETPPVMPHSTSSTDINHYYNLTESMGQGGTTNGTSRQLPPTPVSPGSTDYHSYYNLSTTGGIPPLSDPSTLRYPASPTGATPDSNEDSEDDFVDVPQFPTGTPMYCNITETRQQIATCRQNPNNSLQNYVNVPSRRNKRCVFYMNVVMHVHIYLFIYLYVHV